MRRQYAQDTGRCREAAAHINKGGITTSILWGSSPNRVCGVAFWDKFPLWARNVEGADKRKS